MLAGEEVPQLREARAPRPADLWSAPKGGSLPSSQAGYHGNAQLEVPPSALRCSFHPEKTLLVLGSSFLLLPKVSQIARDGKGAMFDSKTG